MSDHSNSPRGPVISCDRVGDSPPSTWTAIERALARAQAVPLRQAWRDTPQPEFRPAFVRTARTEAELLVYAVLEDEDIFNPETRFNELSFKCGDVFEMFFRPGNQEAYYEFHVSPVNQHLQLRIPSAAALLAERGRPGIPAEWFHATPAFESRVVVDAANRRWQVFAVVPFRQMEENGPAPEWLFSFSRYDYTRGADQPVLSSTSPHARPRFHTQEEWGRLVFEGRMG